MCRGILRALMAVTLLALVVTASASADAQLGTTVQPVGSSGTPCSGGPGALAAATDSASTPYLIPVGGGQITGWKINTTGAAPGDSITFLVLRPAAGGYTVIGTTPETLSNPLPVGGVASFPLASPIPVRAGDTLGLYAPTGSSTCYWHGGAVPPGETLAALAALTPPTPGQTLAAAGPPSPSGFELNLGATLIQSEDVAVTTGAAPATPTVGNFLVLTSNVVNNGPGLAPVTFTDVVPPGLSINSAVAADGTCSVAGNTVTCTITGLVAGQRAPVNIVVTPTIAKSYVNTVSVALSGLTDTVPANNSASATVSVGPKLVPPKCVVPKLGGTSGGLAKRVLALLGCKVRLTHASSKHVAKGQVMGTRPGAGTYAVGRQITLVVSSGRPKTKRHHK
jgi:uncharacterized repeat protein (TIGR01451 family)